MAGLLFSGFCLLKESVCPVLLRRFRATAFGEQKTTVRVYNSVDGVTSYLPETAAFNGFGYKGMWHDATGDIFAQHRYYQPGLGRFSQEDPIHADGNDYAYCAGDPINFWDPTGLILKVNGDDKLAELEKKLREAKELVATRKRVADLPSEQDPRWRPFRIKAVEEAVAAEELAAAYLTSWKESEEGKFNAAAHAALDRFRQNRYGKKMVTDLEGSKQVHTIKYRSAATGDSVGESEPINAEDMMRRIPTGTTIYWDDKYTDPVRQDAAYVLFHETYHSWETDKGYVVNHGWGEDVHTHERRAVRAENLFRLPEHIRKTYQSTFFRRPEKENSILYLQVEGKEWEQWLEER